MRGAALAGLVSVPAKSSAESTAEDPKPDNGSDVYVVDFEADTVEANGELTKIVLHGNVVVMVDRYRLEGDHLRLNRGPRGLVIDGKGRVAFCPCPNPPVSFGFRSAVLAPPTDLVLKHPTVRLGSVPVFWLPYLWLRSPARVALLPPRLAWRGGDGFLAGAGVHLPFSNARSSLDVTGSGYVKGGVELDTRLTTPTTTTRVRWDHLRESLLALDARGSTEPVAGSTFAWSADAVRGPRGLAATILLEDAARRYDRVEFAGGNGGHAGLISVGFRGDAPRGGALDDLGVLGPRSRVGYGGVREATKS